MMGKIYQALGQARISRNNNMVPEEIPRQTPPPSFTELDPQPTPAPSKSFVPMVQNLDAEKEMTSLYQNTEAILAHAPQKIIQFIGSQPGEGTSSVARNFARFSASRLGKKVLLLEGDPTAPSPASAKGALAVFSLEEVILQGEGADKALACSQDSGLSCSRVARDEGSLLRFLESESRTSLWQDLKGAFDLIIIDSPPLFSSSAGLAFCRQADGVVLVLEADRTRGPVAENTRDQIIKNGGNVLGVVFNKRQYYIPKSIYKRL